MQHIWTILCQITSQDKQTNVLSLVNVLEGIQFAADPSEVDADDIVVPVNFHLVTTWWSEESQSSDEIQVQVRLYSPENEDLGGPDLTIDSNKSLYSRVNVNIQGFPYRGDGVYRYKIFHVVEDQPVEVQQIPIKVERMPFQEMGSRG